MFVQVLRYRVFSAIFMNILLRFHVKTFPGRLRYIHSVLLYHMNAQHTSIAYLNFCLFWCLKVLTMKNTLEVLEKQI
jgi:hypothetical protein